MPFKAFVIVILFEMFSIDFCIYGMMFSLVEEGLIESWQHHGRRRKVHVTANYVNGKPYIDTLTFSMTNDPSILAVTTVFLTKSTE